MRIRPIRCWDGRREPGCPQLHAVCASGPKKLHKLQYIELTKLTHVNFMVYYTTVYCTMFWQAIKSMILSIFALAFEVFYCTLHLHLQTPVSLIPHGGADLTAMHVPQF